MNDTTKHYLTQFMTALAIGLAAVLIFSVGLFLGRDSITPPEVHNQPGMHCWQEWNPEMPKAHELICEGTQL